MRRLLHLGLALLVLTAGCVVEGGPTSAATFAEGSGTACENVWVSLWGPGVESFLRPDTVGVGYGLPSNASVLFVAYVDGTAEGVLSDQTDADGGIVSDGRRYCSNPNTAASTRFRSSPTATRTGTERSRPTGTPSVSRTGR